MIKDPLIEVTVKLPLSIVESMAYTLPKKTQSQIVRRGVRHVLLDEQYNIEQPDWPKLLVGWEW